MAVCHSSGRDHCIVFLEKSGFLVGQYIISSVSSLMVPQAVCECLLLGVTAVPFLRLHM